MLVAIFFWLFWKISKSIGGTKNHIYLGPKFKHACESSCGDDNILAYDMSL